MFVDFASCKKIKESELARQEALKRDHERELAMRKKAEVEQVGQHLTPFHLYPTRSTNPPISNHIFKLLSTKSKEMMRLVDSMNERERLLDHTRFAIYICLQHQRNDATNWRNSISPFWIAKRPKKKKLKRWCLSIYYWVFFDATKNILLLTRLVISTVHVWLPRSPSWKPRSTLRKSQASNAKIVL